MNKTLTTLRRWSTTAAASLLLVAITDTGRLGQTRLHEQLPEPASLVLFGTGLLLVGARVRRRPSASAATPAAVHHPAPHPHSNGESHDNCDPQ